MGVGVGVGGVGGGVGVGCGGGGGYFFIKPFQTLRSRSAVYFAQNVVWIGFFDYTDLL